VGSKYTLYPRGVDLGFGMDKITHRTGAMRTISSMATVTASKPQCLAASTMLVSLRLYFLA
jgi:hypothetical protein